MTHTWTDLLDFLLSLKLAEDWFPTGDGCLLGAGTGGRLREGGGGGPLAPVLEGGGGRPGDM